MEEDTNFKTWKLPHPMLLHWVLNPGLCINEVLLGQRVPKVVLVDKTSEAPLTERTYVECPHCHTVHNGQLWGRGNTFRHYAGYYCVTCEQKIPTLLNVFSILLLILLFPIWKPLQLIYGARFKAWELERLRQAKERMAGQADKPIEKPSGLKMGLQFGAFMGAYFLISNAIREGLTLQVFIVSIISAVIAGLLFGVIMSWFLNRKGGQTN